MNLDTCGIYAIQNTINNKYYIGQSKHILRRWTEHRYDSKMEDTPLYRAIRKYGISVFHFSIIKECPIEELTMWEEYYIDEYNAYVPYGYNLQVPSHHYTTNNIPPKYLEIIDLLKNTNQPMVEIGKLYNLSREQIARINKGEAWCMRGLSYPLRHTYCNYDQTQIIPLLQEGYTIKDIAFALGTTAPSIQGYLQGRNIHTSDFRKRLTSNKITYQYDDNWQLINEFNSIKEAADNLYKTNTNIQYNSVLCGIKRVINKNKLYKGYYWTTTNKEE